MEPVISAREAALKALYRIETEKGYSNIVLDEIFYRMPVKDIDKPLVTEIVYGVTSRKLTLDYIIGRFSNIKLNKISPWIINILRMGIYQILFLEKIPASAACNEGVKLARKYGHKASSGFVNAILRKTASLHSQKETEALLEELVQTDDEIERASIIYSHPIWMIKMWNKQIGLPFTGELCRANNQKARIALRVNTLKTSRQELADILQKEGFETEESNIAENALILKKGNPINKFYEKGLYTVQDEAAMLVSEILDPKPGETVVDACSAPGGKTTHMAQLMNDEGKIYAFDIHKHRLELVEKTAKRLGAGIIEVKLHDAAKPDESLTGKCDKVLVDAPCSGLGVIRRKPEIKWSRNEEELKELAELQKRILQTASQYLKPDGRLVYSTCTINGAENEKIVEEFLEKNSGFAVDKITVKISVNSGKINSGKYLHMYPCIHGTDGFFIASIKRTR